MWRLRSGFVRQAHECVADLREPLALLKLLTGLQVVGVPSPQLLSLSTAQLRRQRFDDIGGDSDKLGSREDNQRLVADLVSKEKRYVEIERAGHMIQYDKNNRVFYQAIADFLGGSQQRRDRAGAVYWMRETMRGSSRT